jgi:hypothetical protein
MTKNKISGQISSLPKDINSYLNFSQVHKDIYFILRNNLETPLSIKDISLSLSRTDANLSRRLRELRSTFVIEYSKGYLLKSVKSIPTTSDSISLKIRYQILSIGYCMLCGKSPNKDKIVLVVDHVIPRSKHGSNELSNLQPLCIDCNLGKKDLYDFIEPTPKYK